MPLDLDSNAKQNSDQPASYKSDSLRRLVRSGYNLIPVDGKFPPLGKGKPYQTQKISDDEYASWYYQYRTKESLNWGLLTGAKPYSDAPAIVVVDSDDDQATFDKIVEKLEKDKVVHGFQPL